MSQNTIHLADLLARNVAVQWFEGVAVVQAVCRQMQATPGGGFPTPWQIVIGSDGSASVEGVPNGDGAVVAAHVLAQMLDETVPVRLRLLITGATGDEAGSLAEFSEALSYFERPDTTSIIRALYERAAAAPAEPAPSPPREVELPAHVGRPEERPRRGVRNGARPAAVVATMVAVVCVGVWLTISRARVGSVLAALEAKLGVPAAGSREAPIADEGMNPPKRPAGTAVGKGEVPRSKRPDPVTASASRPPDVEVSVTSGLLGLQAPSGIDERVVIASAVRDAQGFEEKENPGRVYSSADPGVVAPRHVHPKIRHDTVLLSTRDAGTIVDLVVATDGLVEHVKLRTAPRNIHEFMLVSAAKAWRFEPATLNGRPIRFLHSLRIGAP